MTFLSLVPPVLLSVLVGYFVGSVSFPRLAVRLVLNKRNHAIPDDTSTIRTKFGADRASIVLGTKYGIVMGILDMLKVAIPMVYFKYVLFPGELYHLVLSIAGLLGHNWPIYSKFKGG
jgi:glycerol-3-phosphate acyltransferase PlsY